MEVYWPPYCQSREGIWGLFLRAYDTETISPDGEVTLYYATYWERENPVYLEIVYEASPFFVNFGISDQFPRLVVEVISQKD